MFNISPVLQLVDQADKLVEKAPAVGGGILDLFTDNPVLIAGLAILAAIPLVLQFLSGVQLLRLWWMIAKIPEERCGPSIP